MFFTKFSLKPKKLAAVLLPILAAVSACTRPAAATPLPNYTWGESQLFLHVYPTGEGAAWKYKNLGPNDTVNGGVTIDACFNIGAKGRILSDVDSLTVRVESLNTNLTSSQNHADFTFPLDGTWARSTKLGLDNSISPPGIVWTSAGTGDPKTQNDTNDPILYQKTIEWDTSTTLVGGVSGQELLHRPGGHRVSIIRVDGHDASNNNFSWPNTYQFPFQSLPPLTDVWQTVWQNLGPPFCQVTFGVGDFIKVNPSRNSLVAGGIRVGKYYANKAKNPHQTELVAKIMDDQNRPAINENVTFEVVPEPGEVVPGEVVPGFGIREDEPLVANSIVPTNESGVARAVLNSGERTGLISVRITAKGTSIIKTIPVKKAESEWSTVPVHPNSEDPPVIRLSLKYDDLPVNGHPISWAVRSVILPNGNKVNKAKWNDFVQFRGISAVGEVISTTGGFGKDGVAAVYAEFSLAPSSINFAGQDSRVVLSALSTSSPGLQTSESDDTSESIKSSATTMPALSQGERRYQVYPQEIKLDLMGGQFEPIAEPGGAWNIGSRPGSYDNTTYVLEYPDALGLATQGYTKKETRVPFGIRNEIKLTFDVIPAILRESGELSGFRIQSTDENGDILLYSRDLKTGSESLTVNGIAASAPAEHDSFRGVKYFFRHFAPALGNAWLAETSITGQIAQAKRIIVTIANLGVGFYKAAETFAELGVGVVDAAIDPAGAWSQAEPIIQGLAVPEVRTALINKIKEGIQHDYDMMYQDAVKGNGHQAAAFFGRAGGEYFGYCVAGFGVTKYAKIVKEAPKTSALFARGAQASNGVFRAGKLRIDATLKNTGRLTKVIAPVVEQVTHVGNITWKYSKSVTTFTREALSSKKAQISCYLKAGAGKVGGYVVLAKAPNRKILGYITRDGLRLPCRYARIFGDIDPATKAFKARAIELLHFACFTAGTPILMGDGTHKDIEKIKDGDLVMSRDEFSGVSSVQRVTQTFESEADATLLLSFSNGERIETTLEHPFFVDGQGFTSAGKLPLGTGVVRNAGEDAVLIATEIRNRPVKVYNFEVEDTHTYFVGRSSLWVHNRCWNLVSQANRDWIEQVFSIANDGPVKWKTTIIGVLKNPPKKGISQSEINAAEWLRSRTVYEWIIDDKRLGDLMKQAANLDLPPKRMDALARNPANGDLMLLSAKSAMARGELHNAIQGFKSFFAHLPAVENYTQRGLGQVKSLVITYSRDALTSADGFAVGAPQNVAGLGEGVRPLLKGGLQYRINDVPVFMKRLD